MVTLRQRGPKVGGVYQSQLYIFQAGVSGIAELKYKMWAFHVLYAVHATYAWRAWSASHLRESSNWKLYAHPESAWPNRCHRHIRLRVGRGGPKNEHYSKTIKYSEDVVPWFSNNKFFMPLPEWRLIMQDQKATRFSDLEEKDDHTLFSLYAVLQHLESNWTGLIWPNIATCCVYKTLNTEKRPQN